MRIRRAVANDLAALRELAISAFTNAYAAHNTESDMRNYIADNFSKEVLLSEINNREIVILVAEDETGLRGYAKLIAAANEQLPFQNPLEIARLYSAVSAIRSGTGKKLVAYIRQYAVENGHDGIWLGAWQKNFRSVNFYQREGFRIAGITQFVLGEDVQDDFVMAMKV
jgi:GNAT superfamily N-acetyltransferase